MALTLIGKALKETMISVDVYAGAIAPLHF